MSQQVVTSKRTRGETFQTLVRQRQLDRFSAAVSTPGTITQGASTSRVGGKVRAVLSSSALTDTIRAIQQAGAQSEDFDPNVGSYFHQQSAHELAVLITILRSLPPIDVYCEIGLASGGTARLIYEQVGYKVGVFLDDGGYASFREKYRVLRAQNLAGVPHELFIGDSHSVEAHAWLRAVLGKRKINAALIDGDHSRVGVEQDLHLVGQYSAGSCLVALHDIRGRTLGVKDVWSENKSLRRIIEIFDPCRPVKMGLGLAWLEPSQS